MICSCALNFSRCKITAFRFHKMKDGAKLVFFFEMCKFLGQEMQKQCKMKVRIKNEMPNER